MTGPLVSIIVPIYNVERFLDQALSSIEAQTLRGIEVICVNDGSTDSSLAIMQAHAERDKRVHIIDKPNGGYGSACNRGIDEARGEWIAILEPDDWIEPEMYERMIAFANKVDSESDGSIDIVKTPYWRVINPDSTDERTLNCSYKGRIKPKSQPFKLGDQGTVHLLIHHPSIWSAIYRTDFIRDKGIRFPEIPGAGWADNPFLYETLCQAERIAYLDRAFYHYREESAEHFNAVVRKNPLLMFDRWNDIMDVVDRLGVTDESILRAVTRRGFTYLDSTAAAVDLYQPDMQAQVKHMFERMDDDLVLTEPHVPPRWKREYVRLKGLPERNFSSLPYYASLAEIGLYNIVNVGPAFTLKSLSGFLGKGDEPAADDLSPAVAASNQAGPFFSVVIPVYNAETYLGECLDSVLGQTYERYEVVCIDDGSTDSSPQLLAQATEQDDRIHVISKANGGPSHARNVGIEAARGEYVVFLDSDDKLEPNALARLAEALASNELDVAVFGWSCFDGSPDHWTAQQGDVRDAYYPAFEPALLFRERTQPFLRLTARRPLLIEKNIRFDESLYLGEDAAFLFSLYPQARGVRLLSDKLHQYRLPHAGSIMESVAGNGVEECMQGVNAVISVFNSWSKLGLVERYPSELVEWSIKYSLYTVLRQEPAVRNELATLLVDLWKAHLTEAQLRVLDLPRHAKRLLDKALDGDFDQASQLLLQYRIAEYGIGDLALTVTDRLGGR